MHGSTRGSVFARSLIAMGGVLVSVAFLFGGMAFACPAAVLCQDFLPCVTDPQTQTCNQVTANQPCDQFKTGVCRCKPITRKCKCIRQ